MECVSPGSATHAPHTYLDRLASAEKSANRENWKVGVDYARSRSEHVLSFSKRTLGGHAVARKWKNVVINVIFMIAIYTALLEAAGRGERHR